MNIKHKAYLTYQDEIEEPNLKEEISTILYTKTAGNCYEDLDFPIDELNELFSQKLQEAMKAKEEEIGKGIGKIILTNSVFRSALQSVLYEAKQVQSLHSEGSSVTCPHGVMLGLCATSFNREGSTCKHCESKKEDK